MSQLFFINYHGLLNIRLLNTIFLEVMNIRTLLQHALRFLQSDFKLMHLGLVVTEQRKRFLMLEQFMGITDYFILGCGLQIVQIRVSENALKQSSVFVDFIASREKQVCNGLNNFISFLQLHRPVKFVFPCVRNCHLSYALGYSVPQIGIKLNTLLVALRDLQKLKEFVLGLLTKSVSDLSHDVGWSLPNRHP